MKYSVFATLLTLLAAVAAARTAGKVFGGTGGSQFDDRVGFIPGERVERITIHSSSLIHRIAFQTQHRNLGHGGQGGTGKTLFLRNDEKIINYQACWAGSRPGTTYIYYVRFVLNTGRSIEAGNPQNNNCGTYKIYPNTVYGMVGRSGGVVDALGMAYN